MIKIATSNKQQATSNKQQATSDYAHLDSFVKGVHPRILPSTEGARTSTEKKLILSSFSKKQALCVGGNSHAGAFFYIGAFRHRKKIMEVVMETTGFGKKALVAAVVSMVLAFGFVLVGCETYEGTTEEPSGKKITVKPTDKKYNITYDGTNAKGDWTTVEIGDYKHSESTSGDFIGGFTRDGSTAGIDGYFKGTLISAELTKKSIDADGDDVYEFIIQE
ncbi:MAG: hypothetical protein Ta2G_07870 [Termitinemataceae bacterium]|nr:MAG: hypothetical protein Ta2G_07870 [Termitinemataceae bacterium]